MFRNMSNNRIMDPERLAARFHALGNPHRLRLLTALTDCCAPGTLCAADAARCVGDLGAQLELAPSTVSHHLKELSRCGLIHMERHGRRVECRVEPAALEELAAFFACRGPDGSDTP